MLIKDTVGYVSFSIFVVTFASQMAPASHRLILPHRLPKRLLIILRHNRRKINCYTRQLVLWMHVINAL